MRKAKFKFSDHTDYGFRRVTEEYHLFALECILISLAGMRSLSQYRLFSFFGLCTGTVSKRDLVCTKIRTSHRPPCSNLQVAQAMRKLLSRPSIQRTFSHQALDEEDKRDGSNRASCAQILSRRSCHRDETDLSREDSKHRERISSNLSSQNSDSFSTETSSSTLSRGGSFRCVRRSKSNELGLSASREKSSHSLRGVERSKSTDSLKVLQRVPSMIFHSTHSSVFCKLGNGPNDESESCDSEEDDDLELDLGSLLKRSQMRHVTASSCFDIDSYGGDEVSDDEFSVKSFATSSSSFAEQDLSFQPTFIIRDTIWVNDGENMIHLELNICRV